MKYSTLTLGVAACVAAVLLARDAGDPPAPSPAPSPAPTGPVRSRALALLGAYVPSDWGSVAFSEIVGGSYTPGFGSTCGYLVSWLLWRLGLRRNVNRNDASRGLSFVIGQNIARVRNHPSFVLAGGERRPKPGDCYFISDGPPNTEHVGVVVAWPDDEHVTTADAGQTNGAGEQCARLRERSFDGVKLHSSTGARRLVGWIDLDAAAAAEGVA